MCMATHICEFYYNSINSCAAFSVCASEAVINRYIYQHSVYVFVPFERYSGSNAPVSFCLMQQSIIFSALWIFGKNLLSTVVSSMSEAVKLCTVFPVLCNVAVFISSHIALHGSRMTGEWPEFRRLKYLLEVSSTVVWWTGVIKWSHISFYLFCYSFSIHNCF